MGNYRHYYKVMYDGKEGDTMDIREIKRKRNVYLLTSALSFLVLGLVYAWSLFATPLATIYGWELSAVKVTFTICMMSFCVGGLVGVQVLKRLDVKGAVLLAATLLVCGFAGTALLASHGIWALYLCYGVLIGCGTGLGYNVIIASVTLWFPDRTGFASGCLFAGFGLGSLTLGTLANAIIENIGLNVAFIVVAMTAGIVMVLLALLIKRAPENIGELLGVEKKAVTTEEDEATEERELLKDPAFYIYYLWAIIILGAGLVMIGTSKQGALELGVDATLATTLVGIIPIVNGISGLTMGVIVDKKGLRFAMALVATVAFVSCTALAIAFRIDAGALYVVGCLVLVTAYGSVAPIATGFARKRYGARRYPRNLAIVNTDIAGGSAFQQGVTSACGGGSPAIYAAMAVFGGVALVTSGIFSRITKPRKA